MGLVDCIKKLRERGVAGGYNFRNTLQADSYQDGAMPSIYISYGQDGDKKTALRPPQKTASLLVEYLFKTTSAFPLLEAIDECASLEKVLVQPSMCSDKDTLDGLAFDCVVEKSFCYVHDKYEDVGIAQIQLKVIYKP